MEQGSRTQTVHGAEGWSWNSRWASNRFKR